MQNPFITKGYAGAEYFCDRVKETQDLLKLLTNENNMALISPPPPWQDGFDSSLFCPT